MKNIHILPTDKPSRLYIVNSINKLNWSEDYLPQVDGTINQNIYITSDEEIKEGYFLDLTHNIVMKAVFYPSSDKNCKKIILTTDQDLIKDGVQTIEDEFLEWFVKNPSCEWVEIKSYKLHFGSTLYKIIIPKEEHRQEKLTYSEASKKEERIFNANMITKQETLEEITEQIQKDCHKFVESIISKVTYQAATNTFLFMKLAELTLKLKKYE